MPTTYSFRIRDSRQKIPANREMRDDVLYGVVVFRGATGAC